MVKTREGTSTDVHKTQVIRTSQKRTSLTQHVLIKNAILAERSRRSMSFEASSGGSPSRSKQLKSSSPVPRVLIKDISDSEKSPKTSPRAAKKTPPTSPKTKKDSSSKKTKSPAKKPVKEKPSPTKKKDSSSKEKSPTKSPKKRQTQKESPKKRLRRPATKSSSSEQESASSSPAKSPKKRTRGSKEVQATSSSKKRKLSQTSTEADKSSPKVKLPRKKKSSPKSSPVRKQEKPSKKKADAKSPKIPRVSGKKIMKASVKQVSKPTKSSKAKMVDVSVASTSTDSLSLSWGDRSSLVKTSTPKFRSRRSVSFADSDPMVKLKKLEDNLLQENFRSYSRRTEESSMAEESSVDSDKENLESEVRSIKVQLPAVEQQPEEERSFYRCSIL